MRTPTARGQLGRRLQTESAPEHIKISPRPIAVPSALPDPALGAMRYQSPLRYPGAKAGLTAAIADLITASSKSLGRPGLFVEPFAGGAAASLRLASAGIVDRILLADADPLVARFWQVAAAETDWLIDRMWDEPVTLERWDYWRSWEPRLSNDRDLAVKCLFLNRTTFSGILHGRAGPIGGRKQSGPYKIDCRFNKEGLATRLRLIGDLYTANRLTDVWCKDWQATLRDVVARYSLLVPDQVIAYLDPPYWKKSTKLYGRSFDPAGGYASPSDLIVDREWLAGIGHYRLAKYLRQRAQVRWILSYDNHPDLTRDPDLYAAERMSPDAEEVQHLGICSWHISKRLVDLHYSASSTKNHRGKRQELLLTTLPPSGVPANERFRSLDSPHDDPDA